MQNHNTRPFKHFQRPVRGGSIALVAALLLPALLYTELAEVAQAAITTSGNLTGTGTPYNGTANPWATSSLMVGSTAPGSMTISGGFVVNNSGNAVIANSLAASTSTVTVGGGTGASTWTNSNSLTVGGLGTGTLTITGGGSVSSTAGVIGASPGSNGTVTVGGGTGASTWINSGFLRVGASGTGTLNVNTGGLVIATALDGVNLASSVKFNGGTLRITATDTATNTITLGASGGTLDIPTAANTFTISTGISGVGGLTKTAAGTLALSAANTYLGNTTVHAGTLKLSGVGGIASSPKIIVGDAGSTGTHLDVTTKTGGLTIGAAQTLAGIGTVDGNTTILGTHSPGNSPGVQTLNGNVIYASGSTLAWELAANKSTDATGIRGLDFDGVNVTGGLTISAGVTSSLIFNGAGSTVNFANSFWNTSHSWLAFSDLNAPLLSSGSIFDSITVSTDSLGGTLSGGAFSWGQDGNNLNLNYTMSAVPEASTFVIWSVAILSLALSSKYLRKLAA